MNRKNVLRNPALAGKTKRYHAWIVIQQQTVADHSFNVLRIYSQIWGPPSPEVTCFIVWHDMGEWVSGDPPYPSKARNPDLKEACDRIEKQAVASMGGYEAAITEGERLRIKICDLVEMIEFAMIELLMGNKFALPVIADPKESLLFLMEKLPVSDWAKVKDYVNRQVDLFEVPEACI